MRRSSAVAPVLAAVLLAGSCSDPPATFGAPVAHGAREREVDWQATDKARLLLRDMAPATAPAQGYVGTVPATWEELPPRQFRDASWRIRGSDAECALLASVRGGLRMNVDRWADQFGAGHLTDEQLSALPRHDLLGRPARLVELRGTFNDKPDSMLLGLITDDDPQATLKFTGPQAIVAAERDHFLALAASLRMGARGAAPAPAPAGAVPDRTPPADHAPPPARAAFAATIPAGWTPKASAKELHHTFGAGGEVYVAALAGDVRQNLDVWRGEMQMAPLTDDEFAALPQVALLGGAGVLMDLAGDYAGMSGKRIAGARLLVAARKVDDATVFVRLVGVAAEVEAQRDAFVSFCGSIRRNP